MKSSSPIRFGIITPVFNREDCIGRCIESVIAQNRVDIEMWIIDDGSTDNTASIVCKYAEKHEFIRFHQFPENRGVNAARNYGIQNSESRFSILLDSDDYFTDNALSVISDIIDKNPTFNHFLFAQNDRIQYYENSRLLSAKTAELSFSNLLMGEISGDFTHTIRTDILKKFPFEEHLRIYEIVNFLEIFKESEKQLFYNQTVTIRERDRKDSVSLEYNRWDLKAYEKKYAAILLQLQKFKNSYLEYDKEGNIVEALVNKAYLYSLASNNNNRKFLTEYLRPWNKSVSNSNKLLSLFPGFFIRFLLHLYSKFKTLI